MSEQDIPEQDASGMPAQFTSESIWKFLKISPIIIGAVFLVLSIALEHPKLLGGVSTTTTEADGYLSVIFNKKMLLLFIAEVGYAFIIAGIVANFLELNAKREQIEYFRFANEAIKRSVFSSVFGIKHSEDYVKSVIGNCFESPLVREDYKITYELESFDADTAGRVGFDREQYIKVIAAVTYRARNMGPDKQEFPTAFGIPFRPGSLEPFSRLHSLRVGEKSYTDEELETLLKDTPPGNHSSEKVYEFPVPTNPGESTDVAFEFELVKEMSDNDPFGFRRPTVGSTIRFINRTEHDLAFGITPRTSASMRDIRPQAARSGEWEIVGPILPYDSVILWWRTPSPGGEEEHVLEADEKAPIDKPG